MNSKGGGGGGRYSMADYEFFGGYFSVKLTFDPRFFSQ